MEIGREDLSLARFAEAHYDAVAILAEAGREALSRLFTEFGLRKPSEELLLSELEDEFRIGGKKMFCSGQASLITHSSRYLRQSQAERDLEALAQNVLHCKRQFHERRI
jgi:hypothetical protein